MGWGRALGAGGARAGPGAQLPFPAAPADGLARVWGCTRVARDSPWARPSAHLACAFARNLAGVLGGADRAPPAQGGGQGGGDRMGEGAEDCGHQAALRRALPESESTSAVFTQRRAGAHVRREGPRGGRGGLREPAWGWHALAHLHLAWHRVAIDRTLQMIGVGLLGDSGRWTLLPPVIRWLGVGFRGHVGTQGCVSARWKCFLPGEARSRRAPCPPLFIPTALPWLVFHSGNLFPTIRQRLRGGVSGHARATALGSQ